MAVRFDADGETLSISSGLPSSTAFTLCGWYKRRGGGAGTNEMLCGMYGADAPNAYIAVFTYSLSTYAFRVQTNAGSISSAGLSITDDAWYFCALSCGGTGAADAKVRAAALGSASLTTVSAAGSSFVPVGLSLDVAGFGTWSNQALSGFKLFDRVLTDAELLAEMNRLTPASTTNLSAWWPLVGDTVANAAKDFSGNGRDWTANGTLAIEDGPPVGWGGSIIVPQYAAGGSPGASLAGAASGGAAASGALTTESTEFVGQASGTNTATLPAHQAGDLILAFAFRDGNTAAPTVPSGQGWSTLYNSTGANSCAHSVAWKIAAGSSEGVGTFTNATTVICHVYRAGVGRGLRVGASASGSGSSTSVSYTGLTLQAASGKSWVVGFAGHRSTNTSLETPPSGMVNRSTVADATDEAAGHDTGGPVSSWSTTSASVGGTSSGWRSHTIEVMSYALLAGDSVGGAAAEGTLTDASTPIDLAGAAVIAATASGSISTGIRLAGAAASVTLAGGVLTAQIRLQGDALAAAVAAAGLTTAIQLAAAAQAGAQASGDLTTGAGAAALAGNALAAAIAAGALTTIIRLDGAALAGAIAQGVLTTGISLDGAAAVGAAAQGALSTEIRLAGAAIGSALASGDVSGAAQLAGAAIGAALASGDLTTAIRLAGAALAGVQATGDLTAPGSPASLAADAQAIAIAEGGLTTSIRLAGAAASVVQATGSLDVAVTMQASAFASAMASGVLSTQVRLDAAAVAGALASGLLTVGTAEHGGRVFGWRGASRQVARRPAARQVGARPRRYG